MITIGNKSFKNQTEAKSFIKTLFNTYVLDGETLSEHDTLFFTSLLKLRNDNGVSKIGCGIKRMFVKQNKYGGNTLWIERTDGTQTDFSIYKPLERKTNRVRLTPNEIDFRKACRTAIVEDKKKLKYESDLFGDVHHETPFEKLVEMFIIEYSINVDKLRYHGHTDGDCEISFVDKEVEGLWISYHRTHAELVVLPHVDHIEIHHPHK